MKDEDQDILFYAFRYALGRKTGVVSQMAEIIRKRWDSKKWNSKKSYSKVMEI